MKIIDREEVNYTNVLIELSCGASFWVKIEDVEVDREWVMIYLSLIIKQVSLFEDDMKLDWFEDDSTYYGRMSRIFNTDATPTLVDIIKKHNTGGSGLCHSMGVEDKNVIKLLLEEIV